MKKKLIVVSLVLILTLALATPVLAHQAGPCGEDPSTATGQAFAEHHIVPFATTGALGAGGHVPGAHRGFSLCNPSGH
jgi:hypothetical protein